MKFYYEASCGISIYLFLRLSQQNCWGRTPDSDLDVLYQCCSAINHAEQKCKY